MPCIVCNKHLEKHRQWQFSCEEHKNTLSKKPFYGLTQKILPKEKLKARCIRCDVMLPHFKSKYCRVCSDVVRLERISNHFREKRIIARNNEDK